MKAETGQVQPQAREAEGCRLCPESIGERQAESPAAPETPPRRHRTFTSHCGPPVFRAPDGVIGDGGTGCEAGAGTGRDHAGAVGPDAAGPGPPLGGGGWCCAAHRSRKAPEQAGAGPGTAGGRDDAVIARCRLLCLPDAVTGGERTCRMGSGFWGPEKSRETATPSSPVGAASGPHFPDDSSETLLVSDPGWAVGAAGSAATGNARTHTHTHTGPDGPVRGKF